MMLTISRSLIKDLLIAGILRRTLSILGPAQGPQRIIDNGRNLGVKYSHGSSGEDETQIQRLKQEMKSVSSQCGHRKKHENVLRNEERREMLRLSCSTIYLSQVYLCRRGG